MRLKLLDSGAGLEPRAALSASFKAAAAHVRSSAGGALLSRGYPQHLRKFCQEYKHKVAGRGWMGGWRCVFPGDKQKQHREYEMGGVYYHRIEVNRCIKSIKRCPSFNSRGVSRSFSEL